MGTYYILHSNCGYAARAYPLATSFLLACYTMQRLLIYPILNLRKEGILYCPYGKHQD